MKRAIRVAVSTCLLAAALVAAPSRPASGTPPGLDGDIAIVWQNDGKGEYRIETLNPNEVSPSLNSVELGVVTQGDGSIIHPSWSPDGRIAYSHIDTDDAKRRPRLHTIASSGGNETMLESTSNGDVEPAWSPDGSRIAFTSSVGGGSAPCTNGSRAGSRIAYLSGTDIHSLVPPSAQVPTGSGVKKLTSTESTEGAPRWRPDGLHIGFTRTDNNQLNFREIAAVGGDDRDVSPAQDTGAFAYHPTENKVVITKLIGGDTEIFVLDLGTKALKQVTNNDFTDGTPEWSCDGAHILFSSVREDQFDIFKINPDGTGEVNLTNTEWDEINPVYSPDGTKIAYSSAEHGDLDIMVMNANGSNASNPLHLTTNISNDQHPSWSPDGTSIVFEARRNDNLDLYTVSASTPDAEARVTSAPGDDYVPDWGPPGPTTKIYTVKPDGTDVQPVTLAIDGGNPAWSPDGSRLVFSDRGDLFTIQPDGRGLAQLTADSTQPGTDIEPSYSPNGQKMAFVVVDSQGRSSLYTVNINGGTGLAKLTDGPSDRSPVWSPSGTRIAFIRGGQLFTIGADGSGLKQLTDYAPDRLVVPDWSREGAPDTIITEKPGEAVGTREATFRFASNRYPVSFECRLSTNVDYAGKHDYKDCGSMANASANQPIVSYGDLKSGHYDFYVRAKNERGTDPSPAHHRFEVFPPELVVGKLGAGFGTVKSSPKGIDCKPQFDECRGDLRGNVKLTASVGRGSVFRGWSGACSGTSKTCEVTVGGKPVFANARFEPDPAGPPPCDGNETNHSVGPWRISGCFKNKSGGLVSIQPILVNGLYLDPGGGEVTLFKDNRQLITSGDAALFATISSTGTPPDPLVLLRDKINLDLNTPELLMSTGREDLFGMKVGAAALFQPNANGALITIPAMLPDMFGGEGSFVTMESQLSGGIPATSMRTDPFDVALAGFFAVKGARLAYSGAGRTWRASGDVISSSATGSLGGTVGLTDGQVSFGNMTLTNLSIAGLFELPGLNMTSSNGKTWSMGGVVPTGGAARRVAADDR